MIYFNTRTFNVKVCAGEGDAIFGLVEKWLVQSLITKMLLHCVVMLLCEHLTPKTVRLLYHLITKMILTLGINY